MSSNLSYPQYAAMVVASLLSSSLSVVGSSAIIIMARRRLFRRGGDEVYQRLVAVLSMTDVVSSLGFFWQHFLLPQNEGGFWAFGNNSTCSATGFITATFPLMSAFCNAYMSIYFCLKVRNRWKTDDFKSVEKMAYAFMLVLPLSLGTFGVATQNVNPQYFVDICYYGASPQGCIGAPSIECTRGGVGAFYLEIAGVGFTGLSAVTGFFFTFLVWRTYRQKIRQSRRFSFNGLPDARIEKRLRSVRTQAMLYSLVYLNTLIWPLVATLLSYISQDCEGKPGIYALQFGFMALLPIQGLLNCFVYIWPTYAQRRESLPESSTFMILQDCLFNNNTSFGRSGRVLVANAVAQDANAVEQEDAIRQRESSPSSAVPLGIETQESYPKAPDVEQEVHPRKSILLDISRVYENSKRAHPTETAMPIPIHDRVSPQLRGQSQDRAVDRTVDEGDRSIPGTSNSGVGLQEEEPPVR
jgi:hypothetical protein